MCLLTIIVGGAYLLDSNLNIVVYSSPTPEEADQVVRQVSDMKTRSFKGDTFTTRAYVRSGGVWHKMR